nr:purine-binding chemotaxis protein CheW [Desulfuromonadales bacterium]
MSQVLVFRLGDELYGLEVTRIQEVAEAPSLHYIPRAPEHFLGAINFHGNILPVFDLGAFLGFASREKDERVIVLTGADGNMALAAEQIKGFVPYDAEALMPVDQERKNNSYIHSVMSREEEMINLLDIDELLGHLEVHLDGTGGQRGA